MRGEISRRRGEQLLGVRSTEGNTDLTSSNMSSNGVESLLMNRNHSSSPEEQLNSPVAKRNLATDSHELAANGTRQNTLPDDAVEPSVCYVSHCDGAKSSLSVTGRCCSSARNFYALSINAIDLIWSYVPPKLYLYCCYLTYLIWFCIGILVLRKTQNAIAAVRYVKIHGPDVSEAVVAASPQFKQLLWTLDNEFQRPPAIFFLNQYALNMTFNFLCNTRDMEGVHERLIFITLDSTARDVLKQHWPRVRQVYWPTPSLYRPFSFAEGAYQTLYLLRANLAVCLLKNGKSFWMMQQDTFWRKNLFDLKFEDNYEYDALFDQIGDDQNSERAEWVNGANFFVHANNDTLRFFEAVARKLAHWYTPDMGIMIHQCHTWIKPKCSYIPHKIAHSWEWMYTDQKNPPYIMQLDCETDGGSKLMQLARFGFYFVNSSDRRTCNQTAVDVARSRMESGQVEAPRARLSWGRFQFKVYWWIVDYMLWTPVIGPLMKPYLPLIGFCIMITI
uniref:Nucleotide-diphospho-sugar transferase domain-containing protein n=1 Tax=Parascaris univalens TaxID=6257 RepID=A0A914ZRZ6_PARUN